MSQSQPGGQGPRRTRIAVVPAYNEEPTVRGVLTRLAPLVDELIVVDDGSTDGTRAEILASVAEHPDIRALWFDHNRGMSAAYYRAFTDLRTRLRAGELDPDALVFTVDADEQHDLESFDHLEALVVGGGLDALLAQRDLSDYPWIKRAGNAVMSRWATLWAGRPLRDVESGYRVFRLGALAHALDYYRGYKYSETVEVAVVLCRLGYEVRNDVLVPVPVFRSRTSFLDAAIDLAAIPAAWFRVRRGRRSRQHRDMAPDAVSGSRPDTARRTG
ncbi:MAG TPA: glycosyltransferase family 2 protein [Acidimicrobiales bacterium]|nr:glycosyltransferase family 2 protein [Acidimicrobiales bacterium]